MAAVLAACGLMIVTGGAVSAAPRTYYVSPSGSDSAAGTIAKPFRTVGRGLKAVRAGDTLLLRGGTYVEDITRVVTAPGTPSAPITVTAAPGERPVLKGLFWLRQPHWWIVDGLTFTWRDGNPSTRHLVKFTGGVGWVLRNSEISGAKSYAGLLVVGNPAMPGEPSGWRVQNNCIHDTIPSNSKNQDHLIYVNTGLDAGPGLIARNVLFGAPNGAGVKLGGPSATEGGATNVVVRANTIHRTAQSVFLAWQASNNEIRRNLLVGTGTGYAALRGYQLSGSGNVARNNAVAEAKGVFLNDTGYTGIADGGGNEFPLPPQFDRVDACEGFHPANAAAWSYGHLAPTLAERRRVRLQMRSTTN